MILNFILALFLGWGLKIFFSYYLYLGGDLHGLCLALSPDSELSHYYQALICGRRLPPSEARLALQHIGVIHLFVVSGAHLLFLSQWLRRLGLDRRGSLCVFHLFYALICHFHPAIFRAWIFSCYGELNRLWKLSLPETHGLLLSCVVTLSFNPEQIHGFSVPLSWLACLGLRCSSNPFTQSLWVYIFAYPLIQSFSGLSLWTTLVTVFVSPMVAMVLLPLSALAFVFSGLVPVVDVCWSFFEQLFLWWADKIPMSPSPLKPLPSSLIWVYTLGLHFFITWKHRRRPGE